MRYTYNMAWIDITPDLTKEGIRKLKVGQVMVFDFEGSKTYLKVMRKRNGKVWVKNNYLYHPDEVEIKDRLE